MLTCTTWAWKTILYCLAICIVQVSRCRVAAALSRRSVWLGSLRIGRCSILKKKKSNGHIIYNCIYVRRIVYILTYVKLCRTCNEISYLMFLYDVFGWRSRRVNLFYYWKTIYAIYFVLIEVFHSCWKAVSVILVINYICLSVFGKTRFSFHIRTHALYLTVVSRVFRYYWFFYLH